MGSIKKVLLELGKYKVKLRDGRTTILFESKEPRLKSPVFILLEDGNYIPAPEGELELENGMTAIINKNSLLEAILKDKNAKTYMKIKKAGKPAATHSETFLTKLKLNLLKR